MVAPAIGFKNKSYSNAREEEKRRIILDLKVPDPTEVFCTENLFCPSVTKSSSYALSKFYGFRYSIFRSLTSYTNLPQWITGGRSVLELILVAFAFILLVSIILGMNGKSSGSLLQNFAGYHCWCFHLLFSVIIFVHGDGSVMLLIFAIFDVYTINFPGLTVLFALRNNVLTVLFGISFEKALAWHQFTAILVIVMIVIHATIIVKKSGLKIKSVYSHKATGAAMLIVLLVSSMSIRLKKYHFEAFYYLHISMFLLAIGLAIVHEAYIFAYVSLLWALDIFIRYYLAAHKVQADVTSLPGDIIRVSFKKPFHFSPGQYCFISVPSLSYYQYHVSLFYFIFPGIFHHNSSIICNKFIFLQIFDSISLLQKRFIIR
jgi:hypothetical protein